jgi:hypothetical protein
MLDILSQWAMNVKMVRTFQADDSSDVRMDLTGD